MTNFSGKEFRTAKNRGYITALAINAPGEFEMTFVGQWLIKNHNRIKELDTMKEIFGHIPTWADMTDRNLKKLKEKAFEYLCNNSALKFFSRVVAILNDMKDEVEIPCKRFANILTGTAEPSQSVYLNESEIARLENVETNNSEEMYVKSLYLLECYCGARHIDIEQLSLDNIHSIKDENGNVVRNYISYISQKTKIEAHIPLHRNFVECLNNGNNDVEMYDWKFNSILRELCKRAEIKDHTKLFRRGKWEEGEKWQFISSHCGRKSFCSNLYLRGVDTRTIAKMAGHTSSTTTEKTYIVPMRELSDKAMSFFD